ncbi:hypothetical protein J4E91_006350 [Alternaria rosae]|nr:hypothetical protein J4E91_006350 [Alternaria rosae]
MERSTRRNIRYDPFGDYPPAYGPVGGDIAKMDGVISCYSVSVGGPVDGRFFGTIQLELEPDFEDESPRCMEVGRELLPKESACSKAERGGEVLSLQLQHRLPSWRSCSQSLVMTELVKELDALKTALDGLDQLDSSAAPSAFLDTIKFVTTDCRQRLEVFWAKTEKYDSSLGPASRSNALIGTMDKLGWTFCHKEEVVQLQRNLQYYSNVINMLMIRHVAGQVQDMRKETDAVCTQIAERIRETQDTLADVGKDVSSQGVVASSTQTLVTGLHQFIFDEVRSFLADLGQLVNKVLYVRSLHVH